MVVYKQNSYLTGPFYPRAKLKVTEAGGDIASGKEYAIKKDVIWYTDKYGFRKSDQGKTKYEVVILGDSFVAGAALTQDDILSEKLEDKLKVSVYPYAPSDFNEFIKEQRFTNNLPDIVVLAFTEKMVRHLPGIIEEKPNVTSKLIEPIRILPGMDKLAIANDRYQKQSFLHFAYARIYEIPQNLVQKYILSKTPNNTPFNLSTSQIFNNLKALLF